MLRPMYVIFDNVAKVYNNPFTMVNDSAALRAAENLAQDATTDIHKNPSDYIMFKIGIYDDTTGQIDQFSTPECILRFQEIVVNNKKETDILAERIARVELALQGAIQDEVKKEENTENTDNAAQFQRRRRV